MKYYIAEITTHIGDRRFDSTIKVATEEPIADYLDELAKTWYDDIDEVADYGYWFCGYELRVSVGTHQEVKKSTFDDLDMIVTL